MELGILKLAAVLLIGNYLSVCNATPPCHQSYYQWTKYVFSLSSTVI